MVSSLAPDSTRLRAPSVELEAHWTYFTAFWCHDLHRVPAKPIRVGSLLLRPLQCLPKPNSDGAARCTRCNRDLNLDLSSGLRASDPVAKLVNDMQEQE